MNMPESLPVHVPRPAYMTRSPRQRVNHVPDPADPVVRLRRQEVSPDQSVRNHQNHDDDQAVPHGEFGACHEATLPTTYTE